MKQIDGQMSFSFHPIPKAGTSLLLAPVQTLAENSPVLTKEDAVRVLVDSMKRLDREETRVLYLDAGKKPLCFCTVSIGTVSGAPVPIANVFKPACLLGASSVLFLHNHPSGSLDPSRADESLTRRVAEAGRLLNIPLMDHLIVGGGTGKTYSFREHEPERFPRTVPYPYAGDSGMSAAAIPKKDTGLLRVEVQVDLAQKKLSPESACGPERGIAILHDRLAEAGEDGICFAGLDFHGYPVHTLCAPVRSVSRSYFTIGAFFKDALLHNDTFCMAYHEEGPNGPVCGEDYIAMKRLAEAGRLAGIPLLDFVVWDEFGTMRGSRGDYPKLFKSTKRVNYRYLATMAAEPDCL